MHFFINIIYCFICTFLSMTFIYSFNLNRCQAIDSSSSGIEKPDFPENNWDYIPLGGSMGKKSGNLTEAEAYFLANHYKLIALSKSQSLLDPKYDGKGLTAFIDNYRMIKEKAIKHNMKIKILLYWNSYIWFGPIYSKDVEPKIDNTWCLKDGSGQCVFHKESSTQMLMDRDNPNYRQWWADQANRIVDMAGNSTTGNHDPNGFFVDQTFGEPGEKYKPTVKDLILKLKMGYQQLHNNKKPLIIVNGFLSDMENSDVDPAVKDSGIGPYTYYSEGGTHFERFRYGGPYANPQNMYDDMMKIYKFTKAKESDRILLVRAWALIHRPEVEGKPYDLPPHLENLPYAEKVKLARSELVASLAPFLIVAGKNTLFDYGWSFELEDGHIIYKSDVLGKKTAEIDPQWYPILKFCQLGTPKGDFYNPIPNNKFIMQRDFLHASVRVNLEDLSNLKETYIKWFNPRNGYDGNGQPLPDKRQCDQLITQ